jgi:hypothetical protein
MPRDAVERFAARRVADAYVHAFRVGRYTAVRYEQVATVSVLEVALVGDTDSRRPDPEQIAARKLFTEALDQATVLDARVGREIQRSIDMYAKLRKRATAGLSGEDEES